MFFEKWWWTKPKPPPPPNACTCWFATNGPDANSTVTAVVLKWKYCIWNCNPCTLSCNGSKVKLGRMTVILTNAEWINE